MEYFRYYNKNDEALDMYQRLIQYWNIIFDRKNSLNILDNMNFSKNVFDDILKISELNELSEIEPGYASPDSSSELSALIKSLETVRLIKAKDKRDRTSIEEFFEKCGVGCGNGCSNVMNGLLNSIYKHETERFIDRIPEVILPFPNYTVYAAQLSNMTNKINSRYIHTKRENGFLPTLAEINAVVTSSTMAVVITYPNNPAQTTYTDGNVHEIAEIVKLCQKRKIFLIVDNIYQDLVYDNEQIFAEVFKFTHSPKYVFKVYGASKDTPYFSGYRTGYWIGDPCILDTYRYFISSTENSLNTYTNVLFAFNLYFKRLLVENRIPAIEDMDAFENGVFGWNPDFSRRKLYERIMKTRIFEKYQNRIMQSNEIQRNANKRIREFVCSCHVFEDYVNMDIGNVFFIKINPEYFNGTDIDFFYWCLSVARCGILPGNVFGLPITEGDVWFRITLIHEEVENIVAYLQYIVDCLMKRSRQCKGM